MELLPGLHILRSIYSNIYLSVDPDGLTLIDGGIAGQLDRVLRTIEHLGFRVDDLRQILVTHPDPDHAGSLARLVEASGARVLATAAAAALLVRGRAAARGPQRAARLLGRLGYRPVPAAAIDPITPGQNLPFLGNLRVIAAPGHTPEQVAFYSADAGALLCGDAFMNLGGRLRLLPGFLNVDSDQARETALLLLRLAPAVIGCGHGPALAGHSDAPLLRFARALRGAGEPP